MHAPLGTVSTKKKFLMEVVCCRYSVLSFSSGSEGRFAVTGAMSKTFLAVFTVKK